MPHTMHTMLGLDSGWLLVLGGVAGVLLGLLGWVATHMGGSTFEGEAFMASLGRSRHVRPGSGR